MTMFIPISAANVDFGCAREILENLETFQLFCNWIYIHEVLISQIKLTIGTVN